MNLLADEDALIPVRSLFDRRLQDVDLISGAALPLTVARLKRIQYPFNSRLFDPQSLTGWTMRAAIGGGFVLPTSGSWPITFLAADNVTSYSSDWIIPCNPSSDDIENTLNALQGIIDIGGVTVQGSAGFFTITFDEVGARNLLSGNPARLSPLSLLVFQRAVTGDGSTNEVQTLRIMQNVGALASLTADTAAAIAQSNLVVGDATHNAKIRITLPTNRYDSSWTLTKSPTTSGNIGWDDNEAQIQATLDTAFGSGKTLVSQSGPDYIDITFIGTFGLQAITITLDGSGLLVLPTFSGELDLTSVGMDQLFNGSDDIIAALEVEGAPAAGNTRKLLQIDVPIKRPVMTAESTVPDSTIEQYSGSSDDITISATTNTVLSPPNRFIQWFQLINVQAGAGIYTANFGLSRLNPVKGAIYRVELDIAASGNPTVNIRDNATNGTIIDTIPGDSSNASYYVGQYRFDGTQWKKLSGTFQ